MSLHKLSAGSGYDYLTRQVAANDVTDKGHLGLASYYTERGESPGTWVGSGLTDVAGLSVGDAVTVEQMRALFGAGAHPVTGRPGDLGQPFPVQVLEVSDFGVAVARAIGEANAVAGLPADAQVSAGERARIRTRVAVETLTAELGRVPSSRELSDFVTTHTRATSAAVSGFDLTFSPVKSVSTLWALADPTTAAHVERAHQAAVRDALAYLERHALFSRTGKGGIRQVEVTGLVAAAFTHRDSRAGDPDLHTHVAVANKVLTRPVDGTPGKWLSLDGRMLFKYATAASEVYNTRLEHHLDDLLGIRFAERHDSPALAAAGKRAVREVVGIDPAMNTRWSQRRAAIETRQGKLAAAFQADHGRPPTPVETIHLAQQANLETRDAKHPGRTLTEQRTTWRTQATATLGSSRAVDRMLDQVLSPSTRRATIGTEVSDAVINSVAARVVAEVEQRRATWQACHIHAETQRQLRHHSLTGAGPDEVSERVVDAALRTHSVSLAAPTDADLGVVEPPSLRRSDGTSVYEVAGRTRYSSTRILAAETRLLAHGAQLGAPVIPHAYVEVALAEAAAHGTPLNPGQTGLVRDMATSTRRLQVAIAPAGTGKTTALRALAGAWTDAGGTVLALAPSAAAAAILADILGTGQGDTLAKLTHTLDHPELDRPAWVTAIGPDTLVLVDEAGMADTLTLELAVTHALDHGATVRLVGDDQQLAAVGAGGILRDLAHHHGALRLHDVLRFTNPDEAEATTQLRDGANLRAALDFYLHHDRVHTAEHHTALQELHTAWATDRATGLDSLMVAPTRDAVTALNHLAQTTIHAHKPPPTSADEQKSPAAQLADGHTGRVGDLIVTRRNNRALATSHADWVKNGDRWHITTTHPGGSLTVRHRNNGLTVTLPADYVATAVELGYATTIHGAQGTTVDTTHGLLTGRETRQDLYTLLTRGRQANHLYLPTPSTGDPHDLTRPTTTRPPTTGETLLEIALRDGAAISATRELENAHDPTTRHTQANDRYHDALDHACSTVLGPETVEAIEAIARDLVPAIHDHPAWPTLRRTLIHAAADDQHPMTLLQQAHARAPLTGIEDVAATLNWRITTSSDHALPVGELPRLVANHPTWSAYLTSRQHLLAGLTTHHRRRPPQLRPPQDAVAPSAVPTATPGRSGPTR